MTALVHGVVVWPVSAQGTRATMTPGKDMTVRTSLESGYDGNVAVGSSLGQDPQLPAAGDVLVEGDVDVTYLLQGRRIGLGGSAGATRRHWVENSQLNASSYHAGTGLSAQLSSRLHATGTFNFRYEPQYQFATFFPTTDELPLGQVVVPNLDYGLAATDVVTYQAGAQVVYQATKRSSFDFVTNVNYSDDANDLFDLRTREWGGHFFRVLTRNATLRLGYTQVEGDWLTTDTVADLRTQRHHNIDVGVDYNRALSISRRTRIGFGVGTISISNGLTTSHDIRGNATLTRDLARTWSLALAYRHDMSFVSGLANIASYDSLTLDVGGQTSRRVTTSFSSGVAFGEVGIPIFETGQRVGSGRGYDSYTARADVQYALTRRLATYGQYFFYHYRFGEVVLLPTGVARGMNRHGVRGGLSFILPIGRERRPRGSR